MKARKPFEWSKFFRLLAAGLISVAVVMVVLVGLIYVADTLGIVWAFLLLIILGIGAMLIINRVVLPRLAAHRLSDSPEVEDDAE